MDDHTDRSIRLPEQRAAGDRSTAGRPAARTVSGPCIPAPRPAPAIETADPLG